LVLHGCSGSPDQAIDGFMKELLPPEPGDVARDAFNVYDADQRRRSVNLLSNATWGGEVPYLRTYRLLVDDPDPTVRAACLRALSRHGTPDDVAKILPYLKDPTDYVRWEAVMALQRLQHPSAVDPLIGLLRDDDQADVRGAAAFALGQYAESRVFQALVGALGDDDFAVAAQAAAALQLLTGQSFGQDGAKWLQWADNRADLFSSKGEYTYKEYIRPPGFVDYMQFWKQYPEAVAKAPAGSPGAAVARIPDVPVAAPPSTAAKPSLTASQSDVPPPPSPMIAKPSAAPPATPPSIAPPPAPASPSTTQTLEKPSPTPTQPAVTTSPATPPQPAPTAVKPVTPPPPSSPAAVTTPSPVPTAMPPAPTLTGAATPATAPPTQPPPPAATPPASTKAPPPAQPTSVAPASTVDKPPAPAPSTPSTSPAKPAAAPPATASSPAPAKSPANAPGKNHPLGATDGRESPNQEDQDE
jgi:hypothetical protein